MEKCSIGKTHTEKQFERRKVEKNVNNNCCNRTMNFLLTLVSWDQGRFEALAVGAAAYGHTSWGPRKVCLCHTVLCQTCFGRKFLYCFICIVGTWLRIGTVPKFIFPLGRVMSGHHQSRYRLAARTLKAQVLFAHTSGHTKLVSLMSFR